MEYVLLIAGFVLLFYGGRFLVRGSVILAEHLKVSKLVIGVTVVSFGTSAPEMFVSGFASYAGHPEVALGNVIGSNIINILLVLGLTALIIPIPVHHKSVRIDTPLMLLVSFLLFVFILNYRLGRLEGAILFLILISYTLYIIIKSRKEHIASGFEADARFNLWTTLLIIFLSIGALALGSELLVENAAKIARVFGVSERVISISLIAFGTSIPELATSFIAAIRKEMDISIGNIIGSNIFNILAVLGISSVINPIDISLTKSFVTVDMLWMLATAVLLFLFMLPVFGSKIGRAKALVFLGVYGFYMYILLMP